MPKQLDHITDLLKSNGLRVTQARIEILDVLMQQHGPLSHQQIEGIILGHGSHIDRVTIYRTLHSLTECGILHRVMGIDRSFSYAFKNTHDHEEHHGIEHPHFVCEKCALTFCLPEVEVQQNIPTPSGFELKHTEVKLFGYCPECN
jgi:Fur family ferric uptake transcriptional regulator